MRIAKSMYLAGTAIHTLDISSYEDYKKLGLVCPICNEAVFYRREALLLHNHKEIKHTVQGLQEQEKKEKEKFRKETRSACFVHFSGRTDCELRVKSKGEKQLKEKIEIEARHQRLKVYNRYLYEMVIGDVYIDMGRVNLVAKRIGRKRFDRFINNMVSKWNKSIDQLITTPEYIAGMYKALDKDAKESTNFVYITDTEYYYEDLYTSQLHISTLKEVIQYLGTPTGNYVLNKIFRVVSTNILVYKKTLDKEMSIHEMQLVTLILNILFNCEWIYKIRSRINASSGK